MKPPWRVRWWLVPGPAGLRFADEPLQLASFGLWSERPVLPRNEDTLAQSAAQALGVAATLFLLEWFRVAHLPAAATALLITSGISRSGPPLYGMVTGPALTVVLSALFAQLPVPVPGVRRPSVTG
ncbi:hypothetical protein [Streptomyces sp. x-80]|uniref:hypothetical protein n=1 Tax=Streptomyces sp. x-80 TaxID=2789282 RepID=UPI00397F88DE